jgi:hypothetical protein
MSDTAAIKCTAALECANRGLSQDNGYGQDVEFVEKKHRAQLNPAITFNEVYGCVTA